MKNLRWEFVLRAISEERPFRELCQEYGIAAKTGYQWKQRFLREGRAGLADRSRRPHSSPRGLSEEVVCRMVRLKRAHRNWGPRKIREVYGRRYEGEVPSESSLKRVLQKAGSVRRRRRRPAAAGGRLQSRAVSRQPNEVWTVDFKGWWYTPQRERCEPLTVRDDATRYVLTVAVLEDARTETVRQEFERLFTRYGIPQTIRSDNGRPFASTSAPLGLTRLSAWWLALGIDLDRIDPGCPAQNGRHERLHRDIAGELERPIEGDLAEHAAAFETWRREFNEQRPHEALGLRCPAERYQPSERRYPGTPEQLQYQAGYRQRKVQATGSIRIDGSTIALSKALHGWNVGLQPAGASAYLVYFARLCLGRIDLETESFQTVDPPRQEHSRNVA